MAPQSSVALFTNRSSANQTGFSIAMKNVSMHHLQSQVWPEQTSLSSLRLITTGERMCFLAHGGAVSTFELNRAAVSSLSIRRKNPFDEFLYILGGEAEISTHEGDFMARENSLVWLPKRSPFQLRPLTQTVRGLAGYLPERTALIESRRSDGPLTDRCESHAAFPGMTMRFLNGGSSPKSRMTVFEASLEPNFSTPVISYPQGEFIYVLEGSGRIRLGSGYSPLQVGGSIWVPAGLPIGYRSGPEGMKALHMVLGGDFLRFVTELEPLCASLESGLGEILDLYDRHGMKVVTLQVPG